MLTMRICANHTCRAATMPEVGGASRRVGELIDAASTGCRSSPQHVRWAHTFSHASRNRSSSPCTHHNREGAKDPVVTQRRRGLRVHMMGLWTAMGGRRRSTGDGVLAVVQLGTTPQRTWSLSGRRDESDRYRRCIAGQSSERTRE
jgi:hypothetical protein